jgi:hypothetical protein
MANGPPGGARNHHFVPQFYLKGFAGARSKNGNLVAFDLSQGKRFAPHPRNVASRRDYHRVDVEGVDPNIVEAQLAAFESEAGAAFRRLIAARSIDRREDLAYALALIAQLTLTNPAFRGTRGDIIRHMGTAMMHNMIETPERWAAVTERAAADPSFAGKPIPYEEARAAVLNGEVVVEPAQEVLIGQEWQLWPNVVPLLEQRNWTLLLAPGGSTGFATADRPFSLRWSDPALNSQYYSPGLGCTDTNLVFPLSAGMALVGRFDSPGGAIEVGEEMVAMINLTTAAGAMRQIYAAGDFSVIDPDKTVRRFSESAFWRSACEASQRPR